MMIQILLVGYVLDATDVNDNNNKKINSKKYVTSLAWVLYLSSRRP